MDRYQGRNVIVTGAARGIGLGIAQRLAAEGANLMLVDRLGDDLSVATAMLEGSGSYHTLVADLTDSDATERVTVAALDAFGAIDVLVNNAGVAISGTIEDFSDSQWDRTIAINLSAPFKLARRIVPLMAERGYGRVVNISSMNGTIGMRCRLRCHESWT